MRFLFKVFILPVLVLAFIPLTMAVLIYKPVEIPFDELNGSTAINIETLLMEELEKITLDASSESNIKIEIDQNTLNSIIKDALVNMNPDYLNKNASEEVRSFVIKESFFGYQGSWVRFKSNNTVEIESGLQIFINDFAYKTRLLIALKIDIDEEDIILTIKKLTIGNLPLAWVISSGGWVIEKILGNNVEDLLEELLDGIGTFDPKKREIRIKINKILETMTDEEDGEENVILDVLLQFIMENELIKIGFADEVFYVQAQIGKIYDGSDPFEIKANEKIKSDEELETILLSKASSLVLSTLSKDTPYIKLDEFTLNRVLEYFLRNETGELTKIDLLEDFEAIIKLPYLEFEDQAIINIPIILRKPGSDEGFKTIIKIEAEPEIKGNDLYFNLKELRAGELQLNEEHISLILSLIEDNDIIKDGAIVLEDFDEMMSSSGIDIKNVEIKHDNLYLYIQINMFEDLSALEDLAQAALNMPDLPEELQDKIQAVLDNLDSDNLGELVNEMIGEMIETALENVIDNPDIPEEVQEVITDLLSSIDDMEALEDAISNAIDMITSLDDEEQESLFNDILGFLEGTGMSYEDLFDLIP